MWLHHNPMIDDWSVNRYNSNFLRIAETLNIDDYIYLTKNLCNSTRSFIRIDAKRVSNETEYFLKRCAMMSGF